MTRMTNMIIALQIPSTPPHPLHNFHHDATPKRARRHRQRPIRTPTPRQPLADKPGAVNQQVKARGNHEDEAKTLLKTPRSQSQPEVPKPSEQTKPEHEPYNLETVPASPGTKRSRDESDDAETGQHDARTVKKQKTLLEPVSKSVKNIETGSKPGNASTKPFQPRPQPQKKPKPKGTYHPVFGKIGKDDDDGFDNFDDVVKYEHKMRFPSPIPETAPVSQPVSQNNRRNTRNSKQRNSFQESIRDPEDVRPAKRKASGEKTTKKRRRVSDLEGGEDSEVERPPKRSKASQTTSRPLSNKKTSVLPKKVSPNQEDTRKSTSNDRKRRIEDVELDSNSGESNNKKFKVSADGASRQQKVQKAPSKRQSVSKPEDKIAREPGQCNPPKKSKKVGPRLVNEPEVAAATKSARTAAPSLTSKSSRKQDAPVDSGLTKASKAKQSHPPSTNGTMKKAAQKTSKQSYSSSEGQRKITKTESGSAKRAGSSVSKKPSNTPAKPAAKIVKSDSSRTSQSSNSGSFIDKFSESLETNPFINSR